METVETIQNITIVIFDPARHGVPVLAIFQNREAMAKARAFSTMKAYLSIALVGAIGVLIAGLFTLLNILFGFGGF